jgi:hypothetical protein
MPYRDEEWTREEVVTFEDAIMHHNAELRAVRDEVVSRIMPEVVRFYGHWKKQVFTRSSYSTILTQIF